jgi:heme oxygenase (mycobilin-producing)
MSAEPVTLINVFEVPAEQVDEFVASWRERAAIMSRQPGFRDSRLHRAVSSDARFQLVNVAHWDSQEALQAATANPEFQAAIRAVGELPGIRFSANPAVYREVAHFDGPQG